ncbi:SRPBCC family protein [Pontivivens insulae]|uniref:Coenzyme Q-binding protein COQ10 START domain-containing protein n=1 Tax=Pontivivens insulae TaxID=1639689 RepID=A0A2R8AAN4_9RHOB|nr:SRPBCC family protein [Pontivivens insulae]RED13191.1 polyketide cyclase/dehydrase/lipid transport protein [Pontivivens insulae]SPF29283.1 hypothetical protein POI8812_01591 [Pontivivens insulae]
MRPLILSAFLILAACAPTAPPATPPEPTPPPAPATEGLIEIDLVETYPLSRADLRTFMEENPITAFFEPSDDIAPVIGLEILSGTWPEPGTVRRVALADGHYVIERILENEPALFRYQIWVFTNDVGRGVEQIIGTQRFVEVDESTTRLEWTYALKPRNALTRFFVNRQVPAVRAYLQSGIDGMRAALSEQ